MRNLNKPNRYNVASIQAQQTLGGDVMQADENGQYVEWRDYKRALDEIDMLKHTIKYWETEAQTDHARWLRTLEDCDKLKAEVADLKSTADRFKAEVERLRKAGDAMASALILFEMKSEEERQDRIKAWSAAKEGKPSV